MNNLMKNNYLIYIVLFSLVIPFIYGYTLVINLENPLNGTIVSTTNNITFECSGLPAENVDNITLYHDISGSFQSIGIVFGNEAQFVVNNIPNGNYKWNCLVRDDLGNAKFYETNYTFTVNFIVTKFEGTIPNQTWAEDNSSVNAFNLSNYFKNATTYSVSGNSNIIVSIMSNGFVNFSQAINWNGAETITFFSNGVSSNPITLNVTSVNDAPVFDENITIQTINKNTNKTLDLGNYFSDVDSNNLTYTYTGVQHITVYIGGDNVIFSPELNWIGTQYIVFTAYDGQYNISSNNITLNVINTSIVNHQPEIDDFYPTSIPNVLIGVPQLFSIAFSDQDNDPISISWFLNNLLVGNNSNYTLIVQEPGDYNLSVFIFDGASYSSVTWIIPNVNTPGPNILQGENTTFTSCGNNQTDIGENCLNCPSDVKCDEDEICESGQCISTKESNFGGILIYIVSAIGFLFFSFALIGFLEKRKKIKLDRDILNKAKQGLEENTIESYIKKNLKYKIPEAGIREKLLSVGWSIDDINKAFEKLKNENKPGTN